MTRLDLASEAISARALAMIRALVEQQGGWSPSVPAGEAAAMEAEMAEAVLRAAGY